MSFPEFFSQVPSIRLYDPLAALLVAATDGELVYRYADAVRLAGHSCPTVAGAWLMARRALDSLYTDGLPERGGIGVALRAAAGSGTTGVTAAVLGLITGAAGEGGFQGLNGRYTRRGLLSFGQPMAGEVRFTRLDTGISVELDYRPAVVPPDPALPALMARVLGGEPNASLRAEFARLWQARVRRILLEHADDPDLVVVR